MRPALHNRRGLHLALVASSLALEGAALPRFSNVFQRSMVLQRGQDIQVWGFDAAVGEELSVSLGEASADATVDVDGRWTAVLKEPPALATGIPGKLRLHRKGISSPLQSLDDVVLGDVYLFSGQSNVDIPQAYAYQLDPEAQAAEETKGDELGEAGLIRFMTVPTRCGLTYPGTKDAGELAEVPDCLPCPSPWEKVQEPVNKCNSMGGKDTGPEHYSYCGCDAQRWTRASGKFLRGFSAVAWFTGTALLNWTTLRDVPVGLVRASWGASSIASWSSMDAVKKCPQHGQPVHTFAPHYQATLWSHMIAPLLGLQYSAVVWVHGARNVGNSTPYMGATYYKCALQAMINDWRRKFNQASLPFLVVEMPAYCNSEDFQTWHTWCTEQKSLLRKPDEHLAEMRLAQLDAEKLDGVYVVSTVDQGSLAHSMGGTIHSIRKPELGERLALAARAGVYNDSGAVWSGPDALKVWRPRPGWVGVCFKQKAAGKLQLNGSMHCPTPVLPVYCTGAGFEVLVDGVWMPPFSIVLSGAALELEVPMAAGSPLRVRYAWADWPVSLLSNSAGMPARTFDLEVQSDSDVDCPFLPAEEPPATEAPTKAPTEAPTEAPTKAPTKAPRPTTAAAVAEPAPVVALRQVDRSAGHFVGLVSASLLLNLLCASLLIWACARRPGVCCYSSCKTVCDDDRSLVLGNGRNAKPTRKGFETLEAEDTVETQVSAGTALNVAPPRPPPPPPTASIQSDQRSSSSLSLRPPFGSKGSWSRLPIPSLGLGPRSSRQGSRQAPQSPNEKVPLMPRR